jgi:pimeloyl-ACP methyl ester carboxylesterase
MTLEYMPKGLLSLTGAWGDRTQIVAPKSRIRLFNSSDWNEGLLLRVADEALLDRNAIWKTEVTGSLDFLGREKKSSWGWIKTVWALLLNRGVRDLWQFFKYPKSGFKFADLFKKSFYLEKKIFLQALNNALHRAGEVRTFQYKLKVSPYKANNDCKQNDHFEKIFAGNCIKGVKRLTYNRRANPWQQMLEMKLTQFPSLASNKKSILTVDTRFLANQGIALAEISKQENQVNALLDMASFALFMARVIINNHLLSFRMPDKLLNPQVPKRLPGKLKGLPDPEITELLVSKFDPINNKPAAKIRLTRYQGSNAGNQPVAFIHGYSANGTTFAHPSLSPSIAEYLWKNGNSTVGDRDVWVVDLRSSSGMPTATDAWSYEEIALVDIPAALLHIKTITGKKVDVVAHCVGAAMLSMAILTRAEDVITDKVQLGVATYLQNEQLGILSAFNGDGRFVEGRPTAEPHPTINSIVMSQKGPLIRYTEANIFRAYVMKFLQRWIAPEGYAFRQSETPTATEQLIDRLLSTLPYPEEEYDVENPTWPCARTEWVTSRHRMDALYARAFNAANMSKETLACIDDFFGPLSMETVMQTIHFVRFNCITNQRGRGEFVSLENLKNRWYGIPTFSIHSKENGMVDPATRDLIQVNFETSNIPYTNKIYDKYGHQDLFIGHSRDNVFKDIKDFLNKPQKFIVDNPSTLAKVNSAVKIWHIDTPWIGPRLQAGVIDRFGVSVSDSLHVSAMSSPKYGKSQMVLVPVNFSKVHICGYTRNSNSLLNVNAPLTNQDWHSNGIANIGGNNDEQTWLVLMAYESDQTLIDPSTADSANFVVVPVMTAAVAALNPITLESAIDDWLLSQTKKLEHCVISSNDIKRWQKFGVKAFNFALASCQFPPGIMDRKVSEKSMQALANLIDKKGKKEEDFIDFAIFAGDQIYADATAGLMDPSRSDERLDLPYETALRSAPMKEIMQRVPVHMLLDDHEIFDNWEPTEPAKIPALSRREFKKKNRLLIEGLEAYCKYQLLLPVEQPAPPIRLHKENIADREISYSFEHGDAAFYMLNTRSRREYRAVGKPHEAMMFSKACLTKLCAWLIANKNELKFIITPSMLLPRHLDALNTGIDYSTRSDSWDGYPANLEQIFDTLVENGIKNTVFLSGDEHLSCHATATISNRGMTAKIVSIHASGLYAPFPFANAKQEDFIAGRDVFQSGNNICVTDAFFAPLETRFAKIKVGKDSYDKPTVSVEYHGASGALFNTFELL